MVLRQGKMGCTVVTRMLLIEAAERNFMDLGRWMNSGDWPDYLRIVGSFGQAPIKCSIRKIREIICEIHQSYGNKGSTVGNNNNILRGSRFGEQREKERKRGSNT